MITTLSSQVKYLIFSLFAGVITGVLFDVYRIIRGFKNINKFVTFFEDILFWILTALIVFVFLLYTNYAYMGGYVYICIITGIYIYIKLVSKYFVYYIRNAIYCLSKFVRITFNIIFYPFQLLIYTLKQKNNKINKK